MTNEEIELLSAKLHEIYMIEAKRQGDVRHHLDYALLKESTKEYDRALARYILEREAKLEAELDARNVEYDAKNIQCRKLLAERDAEIKRARIAEQALAVMKEELESCQRLVVAKNYLLVIAEERIKELEA